MWSVPHDGFMGSRNFSSPETIFLWCIDVVQLLDQASPFIHGVCSFYDVFYLWWISFSGVGHGAKDLPFTCYVDLVLLYFHLFHAGFCFSYGSHLIFHVYVWEPIDGLG